VLGRLQGAAAPELTLVVGGTNGKGSCTAYLSAMLAGVGYRVGTYTSPHLLRYHERIRIAGHDIDDEALLAAFAAVEEARGGVPLTYFEYGTLAALEAFAAAGCTARVLEVGLGGRLDAVNAVEPDGSLVVTVALDHMDWLGPDRESIGREKAGIFRAGRPAVCADSDPPRSLLAYAETLGTPVLRIGRDFRGTATASGWRYESASTVLDGLPPLPLSGEFQFDNAAASLALLEAVLGVARLPALAQGLPAARLAGRFQRHQDRGVEWVLDVAHNPAAAQALAHGLARQPATGRTRCVFGILETKDASGVLAALRDCVDEWLLVPTDSARALPPSRLRELLADQDLSATTSFGDVTSACRAASLASRPGDRVLVAGSFHTVGPALRYLGLS
jgi:dihydrofolate synthase / folylpolyglutamate synthase